MFVYLFSHMAMTSTKGPDGIGDYKPRSNDFLRYVGTGASSPEATGDLGYLCQAAADAPPPRPKQGYVGAVGWGWQHNQLLNSGALLSNMQIKKTDLRTALEDRMTHRFQSDHTSPHSGTHTASSRGKNMTDDSQQVNTKFHRDSQS
ncbi:protein SPMIP2 isoform X2 [Clinocottus analis]|uniref:protein SPMIP2 isoform X2 n=1 Tax=Clinocottus analis TaxID=304258 RepID=UPI0035BF53F2